MIVLIAPYTFSQFGSTRNYRAIAILHTLQFTITHALGFSVFPSRLLAMELSQSHSHFKSHMQTYFHSLIPFLPLFCSCQFRRLLSTTPDHCSVLRQQTSLPLYNFSARIPRKTPSSVAKEACLKLRCLAIDILLLHAYASRECVYWVVG
jgi:hypothetical protein